MVGIAEVVGGVASESELIQGSESLINTSNHQNGDENDPPLEWDMDAIEAIVRRLPLPSFMRAKVVCKAWNTTLLAADPYTSSDHFVINCLDDKGIEFFCPDLNRWFRVPLFLGKGKWVLIAASKGLFFFFEADGHRRDSYVMLNVVTKQQRTMMPGMEDALSPAAELMVFADHFEILSFTEAPPIVLYDSAKDERMEIPIKMGRNALSANSWDEFENLREGFDTHGWVSTVHNHMICCTIDFGRHLGFYDINRREFDFKEVEGGLAPNIHRSFIGGFDVPYCYFPLCKLVSCEGKLFLVSWLKMNEGEGVRVTAENVMVGIWVLNTSPADNYIRSWSLFSSTPKDLLQRMLKGSSEYRTRILAAASSNQIWLVVRESRNVLVFDLKSMQWSLLPNYAARPLSTYTGHHLILQKAFAAPFSNYRF